MCRTDINTLTYYIGGTCSKNFSWQRFATKLEHRWLLVQWLHHPGGKTVSGLYKQLHWAYISNQWHAEKRTHRFGPPTASQPWSKREPKHRKAQEARVVGSLRGPAVAPSHSSSPRLAGGWGRYQQEAETVGNETYQPSCQLSTSTAMASAEIVCWAIINNPFLRQKRRNAAGGETQSRWWLHLQTVLLTAVKAVRTAREKLQTGKMGREGKRGVPTCFSALLPKVRAWPRHETRFFSLLSEHTMCCLPQTVQSLSICVCDSMKGKHMRGGHRSNHFH